MPITSRELIGYAIATAALICAVAAALIQGGVVAAPSAASAGLASMASVWGFSNRPVVAAPKQ